MPDNHCQLCGRGITGQGKRFSHPDWPGELSLLVCDECQQSKPRCRICSLPMSFGTPQGLCQTCVKNEQVCLTCGNTITGEYVEINGNGPYCKTCHQGRAPCDVCGAPLTDERWKLSDDRVSCAYCHASAVYDSQEAYKLFEEMKELINRTMELNLNIPTGLALVDRTQLAEIIHQQTDGQADPITSDELDPKTTLGIYTRRGMRRGIYVQSGLPRSLLIQIAAHEFAHAWQGENCPLVSDPLVHEGFAEWVAYHVLGNYGLNAQQKRMQQRTDIYGEGLIWALELEQRKGIRGVIDACLNAR